MASGSREVERRLARLEGTETPEQCDLARRCVESAEASIRLLWGLVVHGECDADWLTEQLAQLPTRLPVDRARQSYDLLMEAIRRQPGPEG